MTVKNQKIILAADLETTEEAEAILEQLGDHLVHVKIGPRLFASGGITFVERVINRGFKVFLDLKLHYIPNTVSSAVDFFSAKGIWALTLHSAGGSPMLKAAAYAKSTRTSEMMLLGVTVLTSLDEEAWCEVNPFCSMEKALLCRASACLGSGMDGLVCSPSDLPLIAPDFRGRLRLVVPGIRYGGPSDDQRRTASPEEALSLGADYIVVGRPVIKAPSPLDALRNLIERIEKAGFK